MDGGRRARGAVPAPVLLVLSPFVAEVLLGDVALTSLPVLLAFIPLYGCGALLIRELTRRAGRGWPTMFMLAAAYGVVEEGLLDQSLFNPNYADQHLLAAGHIGFLGLGLKWTIHVLTLHVVWSIATPIALVESAWAERGRGPWLSRKGSVVTVAAFAVGSVATAISTMSGTSFRPSATQVTAAVVAAVVLSVGGFALPRPRACTGARRPAPASWMVGLGALVGASIVARASAIGSVAVAASTYVVAEVGAAFAVATLARRPSWGPLHVFALAAGAVGAYAWDSFFVSPTVGSMNPAVDHAGDVLFSLIAAGMLYLIGRRVRAKTG